MSTAAPPSPTRAVDRALALLATVCDGAAPSLSECARVNDLSPSTALRLLRTLTDKVTLRRQA